MATLYHLSPENFPQFTPKYHKPFCKKGIYITRLYSAINDWMSYVFHKKHKNDKAKKLSHYSHIYLYKLECSKIVLKKIEDFNKEVFESREWSENTLFSFWSWGYQLYIPEELLGEIKIVNKKSVSYSNFLDMYRHDNWYRRTPESKKEYAKRNWDLQ